jgi:hypothetical protein
MLIEISNNINFNNLNDDEVAAFDCLAHAFNDGHHIVIAEPAVLDLLASLVKLSERGRATYRRISNRFSFVGGLSQLVTCKIVVGNFNNVHLVKSQCGTNDVINVPLLEVSTGFLSPTALMLEDVNDKDTYEMILNWFLVHEKGFSNVEDKYRFSFRNGGGIRIADNFEHFVKNEQGLLLCIVDTDRKFPADNLGGTASAVKNVYNQGYPKSNLLLLDVHERENLIPFSVFKGIYENNESHDGDLRAGFESLNVISGDPVALSFFDVKKGLVCKKATRDLNFKNYWDNFFPASMYISHSPCIGASCKLSVIRGFPVRYLDEEVARLKRNQPSIDMSEHLKIQWIKIAQNLFNWCLGYKATIV